MVDAGRRGSTRRRLPVGIAVGEVLLVAVWLGLGGPDMSGASTAWYLLALAASATAVTVRVVVRPATRGAWAVVAAALWAWFAAEAIYRLWVANLVPVPWPTVSDGLYLLFYPLLALGLVRLARVRVPSPSWTVGIDAVVAALGAAGWLWLLLTTLTDDVSPFEVAEVVSEAVYPVADVLLVSVLVALLAMLAWPADPMWLLLALATVTTAFGDVVYAWLVVADEPTLGAYLDTTWLVAMTLVGVSAWTPTGSGAPPRPAMRAVAAPIAGIAAAFALLVYGNLRPIPEVSLLLAVAAVVLGAWRAAAVFRAESVLAAVRRTAQTDPVTGLGNRRLLNARMDTVLADRTDGESVTVLLLDISGFHHVNEAYGHSAGDAVLQEVARRLRARVPAGTTCVRLGGDEFAVLLGPQRSPDCESVADALAAAMDEPFPIGDRLAHLDVAAGVAYCPQHAEDRTDLLRFADAATRRAKRGHLRWTVYDPMTDRIDSDQIHLLEDLRRALSAGELVCHYQPKLDLHDRTVHSVETLIRWQHPERGLLFPDRFVPLAERSGLMRQVTEVVLGLAIAQAAAWSGQGLPMTVAVNLSMTDLLDLGLPDTVARLLDQHGLPSRLLTLEVTETEMMSDPDRTHEVVTLLHEQGVRLSVDDYGQGYSSLAQLAHLRADEIKLDREFVTGLGSRPDLRSIVRSTVALARDLGAELVAEGVETDEDLTLVAELGCDVAQGYFISRPQPPEQITEWLRRHRALADDGAR